MNGIKENLEGLYGFESVKGGIYNFVFLIDSLSMAICLLVGLATIRPNLIFWTPCLLEMTLP